MNDPETASMMRELMKIVRNNARDCGWSLLHSNRRSEMMSKLPGARPTCEHGIGYGGMSGCKQCHYRDKAINKNLLPLVDLFWEHKGRNAGDLAHLMYRAYRMGMKHE